MRTRLYFNSNGLEEKRKHTQHITEVYKKYLEALNLSKTTLYNYTRTFKDFSSELVPLKTKFQETHQCLLSYSSASGYIIFILIVIINLLKQVILRDWQKLRKLLMSNIKTVRKTTTLKSLGKTFWQNIVKI